MNQLGIRSERVTDKGSIKEGNQAMMEIRNFEKKNGLKKLGPPVNKYPHVLLEAHFEMGRRFFNQGHDNEEQYDEM
jgi:hypothetical protein